jgi:hypothetical protein
MIASIRQDDRCQCIDNYFDQATGFERIHSLNRGAFPVRTHASRIRARRRSRGTSAAVRKAREFRGMNSRGRMRRRLPIA